MAATYNAVEAVAPGTLRLVDGRFPSPAPVRFVFRVEACGICHTDFPHHRRPVARPELPPRARTRSSGRIEALVRGRRLEESASVSASASSVGNGGHCEPCRPWRCDQLPDLIISGITTDGGYAGVMIAEARAPCLRPG